MAERSPADATRMALDERVLARAAAIEAAAIDARGGRRCTRWAPRSSGRRRRSLATRAWLRRRWASPSCCCLRAAGSRAAVGVAPSPALLAARRTITSCECRAPRRHRRRDSLEYMWGVRWLRARQCDICRWRGPPPRYTERATCGAADCRACTHGPSPLGATGHGPPRDEKYCIHTQEACAVAGARMECC